MLVDLILRIFFKGKINKAIADLHNDPGIKDKFRALEFAVEELKAATKRKNDFRNSDAYAALAKQFAKNDEFTKKYGPKRSK